MGYVVRNDYTKERVVGVRFVWKLQTLRIWIYVFVQGNVLLNIFPVQTYTGIWWPSRDFWRPLGNLRSCKKVAQYWENIAREGDSQVSPALWGSHGKSFTLIRILLDS